MIPQSPGLTRSSVLAPSQSDSYAAVARKPGQLGGISMGRTCRASGPGTTACRGTGQADSSNGAPDRAGQAGQPPLLTAACSGIRPGDPDNAGEAGEPMEPEPHEDAMHCQMGQVSGLAQRAVRGFIGRRTARWCVFVVM
jgi:hypothetical protein